MGWKETLAKVVPVNFEKMLRAPTFFKKYFLSFAIMDGHGIASVHQSKS